MGGDTHWCSGPSGSREQRQRSPSQNHGSSELQERLWLREKHRQHEELLKALETPEEKLARRLAKKQAKEHKRQKKMGWSEDAMGGTFIWVKALEKKGISPLGGKELKEHHKRIQENNRLELQKLKQRWLDREREKALRERELELLQREKEAEHFKTWQEQEGSFHLLQAKLRSKIRIREGRAKPIDLLASYISAEEDDLAVQLREPYTLLSGLTVADLEDLLSCWKAKAKAKAKAKGADSDRVEVPMEENMIHGPLGTQPIRKDGNCFSLCMDCFPWQGFLVFVSTDFLDPRDPMCF